MRRNAGFARRQRSYSSSRRPSQAATLDPGFIATQLTATVANSSDQPIYHAEVYWRLGGRLYGESNPNPLGIIMPGQSASISRKFPPDTNVTTANTELTFRDAGDIHLTTAPRRRPH